MAGKLEEIDTNFSDICSAKEPSRCFVHNFVIPLRHDDSLTWYSDRALARDSFDGSIADFQEKLFNLTSSSTLRDYGLLHQLPFILRNLVQDLNEEKLKKIGEVTVAHYGTNLIKMKNVTVFPVAGDETEDFRLDIGDLLEFLKKESLYSKADKKSILGKEAKTFFGYHLDDWWPDKEVQALLWTSTILMGIGIGLHIYKRYRKDKG